MTILLDYEILRLVWWLLLGTLLIGFGVMGGYDLGVAMLLPYVARSDIERRIAINAIGPFWEGNQVWLILGAGAVFAAWPLVYAVSFSGLYLAMFFVVATLILRPVGFKMRGGFGDPRWRTFWDYAIFAAGAVPALIFGILFGNLLQGVPFQLDRDLRSLYMGNGLTELLNPFALLCGLLAAAMLAAHGGVYLTIKTHGLVQSRARRAAIAGAFAAIALFALAGLWVWLKIDGYALTSSVDYYGPSNPLLKTVSRQHGQWLANFVSRPWTTAAPIAAFVGFALAVPLISFQRAGFAFISTGIGVAGVIATAGISMFPFLVPSSIEPASSLTVWDSSSSRLTLFVMLVATVIFLPMVLAYTSFVFRVLRGPVTQISIEANTTKYY